MTGFRVQSTGRSGEDKISAALIPEGRFQAVPGPAGAPADPDAPEEGAGAAQRRLQQTVQEPPGSRGAAGARGPAEGQHGPSSCQHLGGGGGGGGGAGGGGGGGGGWAWL